jgi:hypothetical protein
MTYFRHKEYFSTQNQPFVMAKSDQDLDPDPDLDWFGYLDPDPDLDPH